MMSLRLSPPRTCTSPEGGGGPPPYIMRENFVCCGGVSTGTTGKKETRPIHACENDMAGMEDALPICNRRTEISVDFVHDIRWTSDERRARVDDCL